MTRKGWICFLIMILSSSGWTELTSVWKKGLFRKRVWYPQGPIQFLSVKRAGQFYGYYHPSSKNFYFKRQTAKKSSMQSMTFPFPYSFISDMDFTLWKQKLRCIISFYDEKNQKHGVFLPNGTFVTVPSPVCRCIVYEDPYEDMGAVIVTQEGCLYQIIWSQENNVTMHHNIMLPDPIFRAEFCPPFLYILDITQVLHIYCPDKKKLIANTSFPFTEPVVRFHAYLRRVTSDIQISVALLSGAVHVINWSFSFPEAPLQMLSSVNMVRRKSLFPVMALGVYSDMYKIVVAWANGTMGIYDVNTGGRWNHFPSIMDPSYFTRMHISHQNMVLDGTLDGLEVYTVVSKISDSSQEYSKEGSDFSHWITPSSSANKSDFSYFKHVMETPVFSFDQYSTLNWSYPLNSSLLPPPPPED